MSDSNIRSAAGAEETAWSGSPSAKAEIGKVLGAAVVTVALIALGVRERAQWATLVALVGIPLAWIWALASCFVPCWANSYRLTSQRLFIRRGLLSQTTDQLELIRVDDVRVHQSFIQRLLKLGDVVLLSTDSTDATAQLRDIPDCHRVAELIRENTRRQREKSVFVEKL